MQFNVAHEDRNKPGVYIIRSSIDARVYIGSTKAFRGRYRTHVNSLSKGTHYAKELQSLVNNHSIECLSFEVLCLCDVSKLLESEQFYLDSYRSYEAAYGFNKAPNAGSLKRLLASPETKAKLSAGLRNRSPDIYAKVSRTLSGRPRSPEDRAKISAGKKGKPQKGSPKSPETRAKLSAITKARYDNPESKARILDKMRRTREARRNNCE